MPVDMLGSLITLACNGVQETFGDEWLKEKHITCCHPAGTPSPALCPVPTHSQNSTTALVMLVVLTRL